MNTLYRPKLAFAALLFAGICLPFAAVAQETPAPESTLKAVLLDLNNSVAATSNLGLEIDAAGPALRSQLDLSEDQAIVVTGVIPESPADAAGVKVNDVLLTLADKPVGSVDTLRESLTKISEGWKEAKEEQALASLELLRAGRKTVVTLAPRSSAMRLALAATFAQVGQGSQKYWIGVGVSEIDVPLRAQLNLPADQGLVVTEVYPDFAGEKAGLKVHDVLLELQDKSLTSTDVLREKVQELGAANQSATIKLLRGGKPATLTITPVEKNLQLGYLKTADAELLKAYQAQIHQLANQRDLSTFILTPGISTAGDWKNHIQWYGTDARLNQAQNALLWSINAVPSTVPLAVATTQQPDQPVVTAAEVKELLSAIQKLTQKVESLEQAVKKSSETPQK